MPREDSAASVDLRQEFDAVGIEDILAQLDRELIQSLIAGGSYPDLASSDLQQAVDRLLGRGEAFSLAVASLKGRHFEIDGRAVAGVFVAFAQPPGAGERRSLGDAHQIKGQIPLRSFHACSPYRTSRVDVFCSACLKWRDANRAPGISARVPW